MATPTVHTCSCPGCLNPGTCCCSACKNTFYCSGTCQTADWTHHKEECEGRLRKQGITHLEKAQGFYRETNWPEVFRYADLALSKLNQLKDRPVEVISEVLCMKFNALNQTGQHMVALECAKEWYCLWLTKHTHPPAIRAAFALMESCIHNKEYADARIYAHTTWETITMSRDSHIPEGEREEYTAYGAHYVAKSILALADSGGLPAKEKQEAGEEAIARARQALAISSRLRGMEHENMAVDVMSTLAQILDYFNPIDDDDEPIRLFEQAKVFHTRTQGSLSANVAQTEECMSDSYFKRARRAHDANDLNREMANLNLSLSHCREAVRIYRAIGQTDMANKAVQQVVDIERHRRFTTTKITAATKR